MRPHRQARRRLGRRQRPHQPRVDAAVRCAQNHGQACKWPDLAAQSQGSPAPWRAGHRTHPVDPPGAACGTELADRRLPARPADDLRGAAHHRQAAGGLRSPAAPAPGRARRQPRPAAVAPVRRLAAAPTATGQGRDPTPHCQRAPVRQRPVHPSPGVPRLARAARPLPERGDPSRAGRLARQPQRPPAANPAGVPALGDGHRLPAQARAATASYQPGRADHPAPPAGVARPGPHRRPPPLAFPRGRLPAAAVRPASHPHRPPDHRRAAPAPPTVASSSGSGSRPPRCPSRSPRCCCRPPSSGTTSRPPPIPVPAGCFPDGEAASRSMSTLSPSSSGISASLLWRAGPPRCASSSCRPLPPSWPRRWATTTAPQPGSQPRPERPGAATPPATTAHDLVRHRPQAALSGSGRLLLLLAS